MGAQLRGVEVYFSYRDERFHIHLPATLSPIIGKHGVLRCRLDSVRRRGVAEGISRAEPFEASFDFDRRLLIPSLLANHCGISGGSALDITILERVHTQRGWIRRRVVSTPIYPNDTVIFDHGDGALSHFAVSPGDGAQLRLSPTQLARSIDREPVKPMATALSPVAAPPAPTDAPALIDDETIDRWRRTESFDLHPAAKGGSVVDKTREIGIVPPEQLVRQARGG